MVIPADPNTLACVRLQISVDHCRVASSSLTRASEIEREALSFPEGVALGLCSAAGKGEERAPLLPLLLLLLRDLEDAEENFVDMTSGFALTYVPEHPRTQM